MDDALACRDYGGFPGQRSFTGESGSCASIPVAADLRLGGYRAYLPTHETHLCRSAWPEADVGGSASVSHCSSWVRVSGISAARAGILRDVRGELIPR